MLLGGSAVKSISVAEQTPGEEGALGCYYGLIVTVCEANRAQRSPA